MRNIDPGISVLRDARYSDYFSINLYDTLLYTSL